LFSVFDVGFAGLKIAGGVPTPIIPPPVGIIGVDVTGGWFTVCVDGVGVVVPAVIGVDVDEPVWYIQEPVLGLVLTNEAAPPKSQLCGEGFFW
jgi:hypothetical protein